mgnify:CR=1 FL=1
MERIGWYTRAESGTRRMKLNCPNNRLPEMVEETRGELFGKATWRVRPELNVEGGLRLEASTITQSGETADTLAAAKHSPQLEVFKKKGIEVLLMTDRVDEWALNFLNEFDGTPMQSVAKGAVDLGTLQDEEEKKAAEEAAETFKPLLAKLKEALKDKAEDVRVTSRLVDSPACLVVTDNGMSMQLARMLKQAGQEAPESKPVLEVNPEHALVKKLEGSVHFNDLANILFDQALLAEGGMPADPAAYVRRVNALLV